MILPLSLSLIAGYFLGALPFGYLVARAKGINIFEHGSKNPGATNVRRVLGAGPGNLTFALDALKGAVAAGWPLFFYGGAELAAYAAVTGLVGALVGHSFSCFTGFKGGKGVATASGGFLVLMPVPLAAGLVVWLLSFYSTRYVSLASILAALALPVAGLFHHDGGLRVGLATAVAAFVVIRHRSNISRLLNGTENRFVKKPKDEANKS